VSALLAVLNWPPLAASCVAFAVLVLVWALADEHGRLDAQKDEEIRCLLDEMPSL
jgi:hypothetical protein